MTDEATWAFADMPALANMRSLTKLDLRFGIGDPVPYNLAGVVSNLVHLTGLAELTLHLPAKVPRQAVTVPAAIGRLKALRLIELSRIACCILEAGCLDLPNLLSIKFVHCDFPPAAVLPGATALQRLTRLEFLCCSQTPPFFDPQCVQLLLQHLIYAPGMWARDCARVRLAMLPADLGRLSSTLVLLDCNGCGFTQFPLALTQLVALESLCATRNEFAQLPTAITALSRLTELTLGRMMNDADPLQLNVQQPLDARALGDLSGFPALCELEFESCEVAVCTSVRGAVQHAGLTSLTFCLAQPAPECTLAVLQLSQALKRAGRGDVLRLEIGELHDIVEWHNEHFAHVPAPFHKFQGALELCELCGL